MSGHELCPTCVERGDGKCAFEEAIKPQKLGNLIKTISTQRDFAKELDCTRIDKVNSIIHEKRVSAAKRKP